MRKILLAGCCGVAMMVSGPGFGQTPPPAPVPPPAAPAPIVPPAAPPPATSSADDRARMEAEDRTRAAENWIADRADAELAQLKVRLRLSGEQDAQWSGFHAAMRDMMIAEGRATQEWEMRREDEQRRERDMREERRRDSRDERRFGDGGNRRADDREMRGEDRLDEIAALREEADSMTRRAENLRKIADAADPLYRSLDDRQRQRLMRFLSASLH